MNKLLKKYKNEIKVSSPIINGIKKIEEQFSIILPSHTKNLYSLTNGLKDNYICDFIWPVDRIIKDNILFRTNKDFLELYMTFNSCFFIGDAGNGDQFFHPILMNNELKDDIFIWNHETDERFWAASNLISFLDGWLSGKISS